MTSITKMHGTMNIKISERILSLPLLAQNMEEHYASETSASLCIRVYIFQSAHFR